MVGFIVIDSQRSNLLNQARLQVLKRRDDSVEVRTVHSRVCSNHMKIDKKTRVN